MAYAFKAIFSNEMKGLVFPCKGNGAIPFGPSYNDTSVCKKIKIGIPNIDKKRKEKRKKEKEKRKHGWLLICFYAGSSVFARRSQARHSPGSAR
jgi:hypothetical protein